MQEIFFVVFRDGRSQINFPIYDVVKVVKCTVDELERVHKENVDLFSVQGTKYMYFSRYDMAEIFLGLPYIKR